MTNPLMFYTGFRSKEISAELLFLVKKYWKKDTNYLENILVEIHVFVSDKFLLDFSIGLLNILKRFY